MNCSKPCFFFKFSSISDSFWSCFWISFLIQYKLLLFVAILNGFYLNKYFLKTLQLCQFVRFKFSNKKPLKIAEKLQLRLYWKIVSKMTLKSVKVWFYCNLPQFMPTFSHLFWTFQPFIYSTFLLKTYSNINWKAEETIFTENDIENPW
jgi:hypothetical protein